MRNVGELIDSVREFANSGELFESTAKDIRDLCAYIDVLRDCVNINVVHANSRLCEVWPQPEERTRSRNKAVIALLEASDLLSSDTFDEEDRRIIS